MCNHLRFIRPQVEKINVPYIQKWIIIIVIVILLQTKGSKYLISGINNLIVHMKPDI